MANKEQLEILKQGADVWNKWRKENPNIKINLYEGNFLIVANLRGVNLMEADLGRTNFSGVDLTEANFYRADIGGAHFRNADLTNVNFVGADLSRVNLTSANLTSANLSLANFSAANLRYANLLEANLINAEFEETNLYGAHLDKAKLSGVRIGFTSFGNMNLSEAYELDKVIHTYPSTVGTDTIHLSKGLIPEAFLRGCGLSDIQIEYAKLANPALDPQQVTDITYKIHQLYLGGGIQYYSCFISYSSKDQEFAQLLHDDLQNNGVRCWFDREDLKIGEAIRPTIDRQIRLRDKLLVILSENSVKSEWVGDEVEGALEEEQKSSRSVLFPIRLDDTALNTRDDWAAKIKRRRHIGDFSNWRDKNSYQKAFERLLRDLKATE